MNKNLALKIKESLVAVVPITIIVLLLHFTISPMPLGTVALFLIGAVLLILGMGMFTLGADMAMMPMGEKVGGHITKSRKISILVMITFLMGIMITVAEPDLQVLAKQVPAVPDMVLVAAVALGVGFFLVISLLRIVFQIKLSYLLIIFYIVVFSLAAFTSKDFLAVAFDSGGVTTGPITVPFIIALGIGVAKVRGDKSSLDDSFGLVALSSIGPILAVLILGMFYDSSSGSYMQINPAEVHSIKELIGLFINGFPIYAKEVALALLPIIIFFLIFQFFSFKLSKHQIRKMSMGMLLTYLGLVFFLTGVNVGFMPAGNYLGKKIASLPYHWILVPLGMIIGFFIVTAEPAVHVLNKQVEEITGGTISQKAMLGSLAIGMSLSVGLAMIRVITGISIWYFLIVGYIVALLLTFFVPKIFTAIAFDSGGVASGPMTATFLLPFAMGACEALGGNMLTDAFGIVAMVAMTPLVTIQILGLIYSIRTKKRSSSENMSVDADNDIIDF